MKRGRAKVAEMTVIGLPFKKSKQNSKSCQTVIKIKTNRKCFAKPLAVFSAINGTKLIEGDHITKDVIYISGVYLTRRPLTSMAGNIGDTGKKAKLQMVSQFIPENNK